MASESLLKRTTATTSEYVAQFRNPSGVFSILLVVGSDMVHQALAQESRSLTVPVRFSFGWVALSFTMLVDLLGNGRLMPPPDYPCKVFNLSSGYWRENRSWMVGRLLRDHVSKLAKDRSSQGEALRISVYECLRNDRYLRAASWPTMTVPAVSGLAIAVLQLVVAGLPWVLYGDWGVFLITVVGTCLAVFTSAMPQWSAEKFACRKKSKKDIALTVGNGAQDVMIIRGCGEGLDLEDLAAAENPRSTRLWTTSRPGLDVVLSHRSGKEEGKPGPSGGPATKVKTLNGLPLNFRITQWFCFILCFWWVALLIAVAGLRSNTWWLLLVGALGTAQNAFLATAERLPDERGLPMVPTDTIITGRKVMDALMDLEVTFEGEGNHFGKHLLPEFFPGELRVDESAWWNGKRDAYDRKRFKEADIRGVPRTLMPSYNVAGVPSDKGGDGAELQASGALGLPFEKPPAP
jgi:hypothetical protein